MVGTKMMKSAHISLVVISGQLVFLKRQINASTKSAKLVKVRSVQINNPLSGVSNSIHYFLDAIR